MSLRGVLALAEAVSYDEETASVGRTNALLATTY
jgi:hypothetical protein